MKKIGWIWTGVMWHAMVQHIIKAWNTVSIYNRTKSKTADLQQLWAEYVDSVAQLADQCDIIFSIIWDPASVQEVYFWENGLIENSKDGAILVDMTTTKPSLSSEIYELAAQKNISTLDAPVSGGDTGARNGSLSIMVWWDKNIFQEILPLFELMGTSITYIWKAGTGQETKMANQIAIAWNTIGMTESLLYAEKTGLDLETTIRVLCAGGAQSWGYTNLAPRILKWDFETYFFIKHYVKDMWIALEECKNMDIKLPGLELVYKLYTNMIEKWEWDLWMQSLILELKRINNISLDS